MEQKGKVKHIFPGGNTSQGFYSFFDSVLNNMDRIFVIKGGPGTGKSTLIRLVGMAMVDRGYDIEYLHCASDNDSLDGVVMPALKVAIVDGTAPHVIDPKYPGAVDEIVNLGDHWDRDYLVSHRQEIKECTGKISKCFNEAYDLLKEAKAIQDEWKGYLIGGLDFKKVNRKADSLIEALFRQEPEARHLFGSAITPEGPVDFIANLTEDCHSRFILKGPPGTGKSALLQKVSQAAVERGYSVDIYHCPFDPDSLDMVIIPSLSTAVIDGTPPHVFEPQRPGDCVVDMAECVDHEVTTKNEAAITEASARFQKVFAEAVAKVNQAKRVHDRLETYYIEAMDFEEVDQVREKLIGTLLAHVAEQEQRLGRRPAVG